MKRAEITNKTRLYGFFARIVNNRRNIYQTGTMSLSIFPRYITKNTYSLIYLRMTLSAISSSTGYSEFITRSLGVASLFLATM